MFDRVTRSLLHRTDQDGTLIPVSRLNDSEKLKPLAVVMKCPGTRFWQKTKYKVTDFTLSDLLVGEPMQPELKEKVFLNNYEETKHGDVSGSAEVDMPGVSMKTQARGASKILSPLGKLLKESVNMPSFIKDSRHRSVDLQHNLIRQTQGKKQIFTVVKERIFTTRDCKINVSELKKGSALFNVLPGSTVRLYNSICLQNTRDVIIDIPPQTVMAYSVCELYIQRDGHYDIDVSTDGIETDDSPVQQETEVDSVWAQTQFTAGSPLSVLNKELTSIRKTLCVLADLSPQTRSSLLQRLEDILPDQTLLSTLEHKLEKICADSVYDSHLYLLDTSDELTDSFLHVLQSDADRMESQRQLILTAMHTLISAAEELTNEVITLIQTFSSEAIILLNEFVDLLTNSSRRALFRELPFKQRDGEMLQKLDLLFVLSNISLQRENDELYATIGSGSKVLPVVLCIVIHGLACLNDSCEVD